MMGTQPIIMQVVQTVAKMIFMATARIQFVTIQVILWQTALAVAPRALMGTARTRMTRVEVLSSPGQWLS